MAFKTGTKHTVSLASSAWGHCQVFPTAASFRASKNTVLLDSLQIGCLLLFLCVCHLPLFLSPRFHVLFMFFFVLWWLVAVVRGTGKKKAAVIAPVFHSQLSFYSLYLSSNGGERERGRQEDLDLKPQDCKCMLCSFVSCTTDVPTESSGVTWFINSHERSGLLYAFAPGAGRSLVPLIHFSRIKPCDLLGAERWHKVLSSHKVGTIWH